MRRILVVANQTLAGEHLLEVLRERVGSGPAEFRVVVPATLPPEDHVMLVPAPGGLVSGPADIGPHEEARRLAEERLEAGLDLIRGLGCRADGEIGDPDPMHAVNEAVRGQAFDEIIISTLPSGVSRWLRADLPSRVRRKHHVPVTTVTPAD